MPRWSASGGVGQSFQQEGHQGITWRPGRNVWDSCRRCQGLSARNSSGSWLSFSWLHLTQVGYPVSPSP